MKNYLIILLVVIFPSLSYSQVVQDTTVKLDLLKAPSSPGSNLLGIANSDIDKPTDVSAFMVNLLSASNTLTQLPVNYSVEFAPYWLFSKRLDFTTASLNSKLKSDIFKQSFVLSMAVRNPDSTNKEFNYKNAYAALGFKFSLCRGDYTEKTKKVLYKIGGFQSKINQQSREKIKLLITNDSIYKKLSKQRAKILTIDFDGDESKAKKDSTYILIDSLMNEMTENVRLEVISSNTQNFKSLQQEASTLKLIREGWSWDVAGGVSGEFINKRFDNSKVCNAGIWTVIGHTGKKAGSILFLLRFLYNPNKIFALSDSINKKVDNISTLDFGARYVLANIDSKFSCSAEAIYRSVLKPSTIPSSWRLILNAEYAIWQNQKITFSFGRNFDGVTSKDGNLVAALGFLFGLGNNR